MSQLDVRLLSQAQHVAYDDIDRATQVSGACTTGINQSILRTQRQDVFKDLKCSAPTSK